MIHMRHRRASPRQGAHAPRRAHRRAPAAPARSALARLGAAGRGGGVAGRARGYGGASCAAERHRHHVPPPSKPEGGRQKEEQQRLTDEVLYILWDLGLKVGYSFRSVDEAFAERDGTCGRRLAPRGRFVAATSRPSGLSPGVPGVLSQGEPRATSRRLEDQAQRRPKAATPFSCRNRIKSGVGGLRGFPPTRSGWRASSWASTPSTSSSRAASSGRPSCGDLKRAYNFSARAHELHFESRKATDILHLEKQPRIASNSLPRTGHPRRVEVFMRDYYAARRRSIASPGRSSSAWRSPRAGDRAPLSFSRSCARRREKFNTSTALSSATARFRPRAAPSSGRPRPAHPRLPPLPATRPRARLRLETLIRESLPLLRRRHPVAPGQSQLPPSSTTRARPRHACRITSWACSGASCRNGTG